MTTYQAELDFAVETAWIAGQLTLEFFRLGVDPELKSDMTPVTEADRGAEELIRSRIAEAYSPATSWSARSSGRATARRTSEGSRRPPLVRPIRSTAPVPSSAACRSTASSSAWKSTDRSRVGVAHFPGIGETVAAASGHGCTLNGEPAQVRETPSMAQGYVSFGDPGLFVDDRHRRAWQRIMDEHRLPRRLVRRLRPRPGRHRPPRTDGRPEDERLGTAGRSPSSCAKPAAYFGDWDGNETIHGDRAFSTTRRLLPEVLELLAD